MWLRFKIKFFYSKRTLSLGILEKRISFWKPFLMLLPAIIAVLLFTLIPFLITIINSFTVTGKTFNDQTISWDNYYNIFKLIDFQVGLRNSLIYTILSVPISLAISLLIASTIVNLTRRFLRDAWLTVFFMPYVTSAVAVSTAFYYILNTDKGLINTISGIKTPWLTAPKGDNSLYSLFAIVINGVWSNLALQILILSTAMLAVNKDLYKAASIDGAGKVKQFFAITLPSINRTMNFLITIGIIGSIKVFPLALFNNDPNAAINANGSTLMLLIFLFTKNAGSTYFLSGTVSIILFLIGIVTSIILNSLFKVITKSAIMIGDYRVKSKINNAKLLY